ncbi:MAG: Sec-independent protein translocase protein TatB [Halioglobus sp.]|nr:Sec-independent protein translocase protein TatB [Halioglobus sp.]
MFDIGFAELIIIGIVALLVIGPERLPGTIRTASLYLNRLRRGFNEIKQEVQQELHNDAVMRELRETSQQLQQETRALEEEIRDGADKLSEPLAQHPPATTTAPAADGEQVPGDEQERLAAHPPGQEQGK